MTVPRRNNRLYPCRINPSSSSPPNRNKIIMGHLSYAVAPPLPCTPCSRLVNASISDSGSASVSDEFAGRTVLSPKLGVAVVPLPCALIAAAIFPPMVSAIRLAAASRRLAALALAIIGGSLRQACVGCDLDASVRAKGRGRRFPTREGLGLGFVLGGFVATIVGAHRATALAASIVSLVPTF